jgi:hypothetical protein
MFRYHHGRAGSRLDLQERLLPRHQLCRVYSRQRPAHNCGNGRNPGEYGVPQPAQLCGLQIKAMQTANVPIILAIFHETQPNGWFWWSKGTGSRVRGPVEVHLQLPDRDEGSPQYHLAHALQWPQWHEAALNSVPISRARIPSIFRVRTTQAMPTPFPRSRP